MVVHKCGYALGEDWYFVTKIVLLWEKKCSSDRERLLKFEAEGWSLEQFIQTVKGKNNFWNKNAFLLVPGGFSYLIN